MYVLLIVVCPFVLFLLAIVLSVLLRYTDSDCPFGIFKHFLQIIAQNVGGRTCVTKCVPFATILAIYDFFALVISRICIVSKKNDIPKIIQYTFFKINNEVFKRHRIKRSFPSKVHLS